MADETRSGLGGPLLPPFPPTDERLARAADNAATLTAEVVALRAGIQDQVEALNAEREARKTAQRKSWKALAGSYALWLLDILIIVYVGVTSHAADLRSACQAQQNNAFRSAIVQRNDAATKERQAQRNLFDKVLDPASTPAERLKATQAYYATLVAADKQRNSAPLPNGNC